MVNMILSELINDNRIRRWANRAGHQLTIGLITNGERLFWKNGQMADEHDVLFGYEIGSITKTMTGLLLAVGEQRGLWNRSDLVADLHPEWASSPFARKTTLLHLVTHTSGLPRVPENLDASMEDPLNPYAAYSEQHLQEAVLAESEKENRRHQYSNYGFGLLGWLLAKRLGMSLDDVLQEFVFEPLGMNHTGIGLSDRPPAMLPVYTAKGKPVPHWTFQDTMAGAGAVRSTVSDMLRYIGAHLFPARDSLEEALMISLAEHHALIPKRGVGIGYGWMMYRERDGSPTYWHNGGTYGSSSFAAFNRQHGTGLVILSNYGADLWSHFPLIGLARMNVDKLARMLADKLFL